MPLRPNKYLRQIARIVGDDDQDRAVAAFVRSKRGTSESLQALAMTLGVDGIVEGRLAFEGGLFRLPSGRLIIKLNASSPLPRKRFTLAHEIGHLLLGTIPARRGGQAGVHGVDPVLERACDAIAAELLMPSEDAITYLRSLGAPSAEKLRVFASEYGVSLRAAAIRVHSDFRIWKCCIALWQRKPDVRTVWFVGKRRWDRTEPTSYALDLALWSETSVQQDEVWPQGIFNEPISLELLRMGSNEVLGLVGPLGFWGPLGQ